MANLYVKSGQGTHMTNRTWTVGERMYPMLIDTSTNYATARKWTWECTTGGTSTGTPTWPASVTADTTTVTQNGVVWTARTPGYSSGSTVDWTFAGPVIGWTCSAAAAGDTVYVSNEHSVLTSQNTNTAPANTAGTLNAPCRILCVTEDATPVLTTGAVERCSLNGGFQSNNCAYYYGVDIGATVGAIWVNQTVGTREKVVFDHCILNAGTYLRAGLTTQTAADSCELLDTDFYLRAANAFFRVECDLLWSGGAIASGSAACAGGLFILYSANVRVEGVDFSNIGTPSTFCLVQGGSYSGKIVFRNCKLPTGWGGALVSSAPGPGLIVEMHNCDSADTNYRMHIEQYAGSIKQQTGTLVRTGGASDGTTAFSWKLDSNANALYPMTPLVSPEISVWNETTGSSKTVTVEVLTDSATSLNDDEIWIEVQHLGTSGYPISTLTNDAKANVLAAAAAQTSSSATWDTTGMTNPTRQKLSVDITPQEKGYLQAKVYLAKQSVTVYVDPLITVA